MPELAEVEYYRRRWDCGVGQRVLRVELNSAKRIFRDNDPAEMQRILSGATFSGSETHGKQMLFRFSRRGWLGLHLGMTGNLRVEGPAFKAGRHDHLVLRQARRSLVLNDPRLFGRVRFHPGPVAPPWWTRLPPAVTSITFTAGRVTGILARHARAPIKAVLLDQAGFPGIGNWMADEILWRAKIHPGTAAGVIARRRHRELWRQIRFVCREALRIVAPDFSDPPASWLVQHRWEKGGRCPRDHTQLRRATIGGRTTAWCERCQGASD